MKNLKIKGYRSQHGMDAFPLQNVFWKIYHLFFYFLHNYYKFVLYWRQYFFGIIHSSSFYFNKQNLRKVISDVKKPCIFSNFLSKLLVVFEIF